MALDLSTLTNIVGLNIPGWVVAVLAVAAAFMVVTVTSAAAYMVIGAVRGQKFVGGKMWDKDVYETAMRDLYKQKRSGQLMDRSANEALRDYQGLGRGRSGRI